MPSDISSAGITQEVSLGYGSTSRKDVLGRVDIPIVAGAAGRARPVPDRQWELDELVPAGGAEFAGRVPAVEHYQRLPSAFGLEGVSLGTLRGNVMRFLPALTDGAFTLPRTGNGERDFQR